MCNESLPTAIIACVGGGSNAIGIFYTFLEDNVRLVGVEAAGHGINTDKHSATLSKGEVGVLHGSASYLLQTGDGQVKLPHSISAGLDYPGVGPEHSYLKSTGRVEYASATDGEAIESFQWMSQKEGILPALESSHAIAFLKQRDNMIENNSNVVVCLSGRGDKDVQTVADRLGRRI
jgi:tryptophan synthase beta chain